MTADTKRLFEAIENGNKDVVDKLLDKPSTDVSWQNEKEVGGEAVSDARS